MTATRHSAGRQPIAFTSWTTWQGRAAALELVFPWPAAIPRARFAAKKTLARHRMKPSPTGAMRRRIGRFPEPERQNAMSKNQPTQYAYHVREGEEKSYWTRIGALWPHSDGKGSTLQLSCIPIDGRVTLRDREQDEGQGNEAEA